MQVILTKFATLVALHPFLSVLWLMQHFPRLGFNATTLDSVGCGRGRCGRTCHMAQLSLRFDHRWKQDDVGLEPTAWWKCGYGLSPPVAARTLQMSASLVPLCIFKGKLKIVCAAKLAFTKMVCRPPLPPAVADGDSDRS